MYKIVTPTNRTVFFCSGGWDNYKNATHKKGDALDHFDDYMVFSIEPNGEYYVQDFEIFTLLLSNTTFKITVEDSVFYVFNTQVNKTVSECIESACLQLSTTHPREIIDCKLDLETMWNNYEQL